MTDDEDNISRGVARTVRILTALGCQSRLTSVSQVADAADLSRAAAHRILQALQVAGAVRRGRDGYRLGPLMFELGRRVILGKIIAEASQASIEGLTHRFGEAAHAAILENDEVELVAYSPSYRSHSLGRRIGVKMPAYIGSSGKVLLAAYPAADLRRYLTNVKLHPATRNTITSVPRLMSELERVRNQGYAINRAEHFDGHVSVAVPIAGFDGKWLAAVAVSAPVERMPDPLIGDILSALRETSCEISRILFHRTVSVFPSE